MDLLANRETTVTRTGATQLLTTPALTDAGTPTDPPAPAVIQHAVPSTNAPTQTQSSSRPQTALLPIPPPASIRRDSRTQVKTILYKPHDIRAVSAALREIMDRENPSSPIFAIDNDSQPSDTDIMRSYAIDTLFASEYYTGDKEEIETAEALRTPDREQFIIAIRKEIQSLISDTKTLQPITQTATGYEETVDQKRV